MIEVINPLIQKRIEDYRHLPLGGKEVVTPYFINDKRRKDLRAMVGKGTPEEIVMEARIWEKLKGINLGNLETDSIKQFLSNRGLGIDCSGFIVHILDSYYKETKHRAVWHYLKIPQKNLMARLRYWLRPVEQLGAEIITNEDNCIKVQLKDVMPGDLIRSKAKKTNGHHIMIVSAVEKNEAGNVVKIEYTHSTPHYKNLNGIKNGIIEVIDQNKSLEEQKWLEVDEAGINHTLEGFLTNVEDNGIRRLKSIN